MLTIVHDVKYSNLLGGQCTAYKNVYVCPCNTIIIITGILLL